MGTGKLQRIINDKKRICTESNKLKVIEKYNNLNDKNVNQWLTE